MDAFAQKIKAIFEKGLPRPLDDTCVDPLYTEVECTLTVNDCRAIMAALTPDLPKISESTVAHTLIERTDCPGVLYSPDEGPTLICNECGWLFEVTRK